MDEKRRPSKTGILCVWDANIGGISEYIESPAFCVEFALLIVCFGAE